MSWLNNLFPILLFVGIGFTAIGSIGKSIIDNRNQRKVVIERIQQSEKMDSLVKSIGEVQERLDPFAEYAKQKFPDKGPDEALELLQQQLKSTNERVSEIETKIKPRSIEQNMMSELIEKMKPISNKIAIVSQMGDAESLQLSNQIVSIFNRDGRKFKIEQVQRTTPIFGLYIVGENNILDDEAKLILESFQFLGMQAATMENETPETIRIIVGSNPKK